MTAKQAIGRNRILIIAVGLSLACHLCWLSVFRVVAPTVTRPVKFSKVAFLGPILDRGIMEVRVTARERTFLENRYLELIQGSSVAAATPRRAPAQEGPVSSAANARLITLIDDAVSGPKLEPPGAF